MAPPLEKILFVSSFLPVAAFKTIARVGQATWGQTNGHGVKSYMYTKFQILCCLGRC